MITLAQAEATFGAAPDGVAAVSARALDEARTSPKAPARVATQILHVVLFLTILISPLVFIEPSPYEAAAGVLFFACLLAGIRLDRQLMPMVLLLAIWNISGAFALTVVVEKEGTILYTVTSCYLGITAIVFACLFCDDTIRRLEIMRRAYLITAVITAIVGTLGYFGIVPAAELNGRAKAAFKDPNVYGPFLILPMLFLIQSITLRGIRIRHVAMFGVIAFGLLLSFSRGAWAHFAVSAAVMLALMFLTAPDMRTRLRLILLSGAVVVALASLFMVAISFDSVGEMFKERAKLTQSYDVGQAGRFGLQETAIAEILNHPLGMGPHEFGRVFGGQQHNVYQQALLVYGWVGGIAYGALVGLTLLIGLRAIFIATPWQQYLISAYAAFVGDAFEGFIIDTDHWRHFFLWMGLVWGLAAASRNSLSSRNRAPAFQPANG